MLTIKKKKKKEKAWDVTEQEAARHTRHVWTVGEVSINATSQNGQTNVMMSRLTFTQ